MMWSMWNVQDDKNPARRISFGTNRTRADQLTSTSTSLVIPLPSTPQGRYRLRFLAFDQECLLY